MRVLMISKALVAGTSQRKLEELAKCPGVELTLVTPEYWQSDDGSKQVLEPLYTSGYRMIVTPMTLNGNFHLHYYPHLSKIMREVRPEVVHIDTEIYRRSMPLPTRTADAPFVLGYLGRLVENKGLPLLVEALASLPEYCHVVFTGNGPMKSELEALAARLGVTERTNFKAGVPTFEVPKELQQMDVLVLPSLTRPNWKEQFGRVLAEAMACETPVIGSSSGEIPYVIGDAGLIFPESNAQELAACVRRLLDGPELYASLARRGRQRVLENYTQEQIARQTYEVYLEMMGKQQQGIARLSSFPCLL